MRTRIVPIGNSQGLRIPKAILNACGLRGEVELSIEEDKLIVEPSREVRQGWAAAAQHMADSREDELLDPAVPTEFDGDEWEW
jgi:antitoxin MazE